MKRLLFILLAGAFVFSSFGIAVATSENAADAPGQQEDAIETDESEDEDTEDEEKTEEENEKEKKTQEKIRGSKPGYNPRSDVAREHMSGVAKAVEELVRFSDRSETAGIGEQVSAIAKAQGDSEDKTNEAIDNAEKRGGFKKFLIGANYKELKTVKQEMQENEKRIKELNKLANQIEDETEKDELQEQIDALTTKNTEFSDYLKEETSGISLFGWLYRWTTKY